MGTYKINPLSLANSAAGFGIADLFKFKPEVINMTTWEDADFYTALEQGGNFYGKEFRISKKAHHNPPQGIPIADRFIEFVVPQGIVGGGVLPSEDVYLIEAPIIRCNRNKIINKTHVYGYTGTIKEFVAISDWMIDFTFYIYGKRPMELDYDELSDFLALNDLNQSIPINSPILNDVYEIDRVVIESINNIQEHETYKNVLVINMTLSSDDDYEPFTKTNPNA